MLDTANHVAPAVKVTRETLESVLTTLPFIARQALKLASRIEYGSLTLRLPDGRGFVFEGAQKGPDAEMIIQDYAFAKRMMTGGDIGVADPSYVVNGKQKTSQSFCNSSRPIII